MSNIIFSGSENGGCRWVIVGATCKYEKSADVSISGSSVEKLNITIYAGFNFVDYNVDFVDTI